MAMTEKKTVYFAGKSGEYFPFKLHTLDSNVPDIGAVYIWTSFNQGSYTPLFVGETESLLSRIKEHEKWVCILISGVNSICIHPESDASVRHEIVQELIGRQRPPCNDLL